MDVLTELAKYPVFTIEDVKKLVGNEKTAYSQLDRLMKRDRVRKVRKNIYSVVNPTTGLLVATRYQIACAITDTAYISHHSAFEYYGYANQVFHEVFVSTTSRFTDFSFDGITFTRVSPKIDSGVITTNSGIRVTDLERTVIDSIYSFEKIGGLEELLRCLLLVPALRADNLS